MPAPKFFMKISSKGSSEDILDANPDATPSIRTEEMPPETSAIADLNAPKYSDAMNEAWNVANAELPQAHGVERFLNDVGTPITSVLQRMCANAGKAKVQNVVTPSDGQHAVVNTLATPAKALTNAPRIADDIEKGVSSFMETVPVLMKALDEVAKVHPFIAGMSVSVSDM